MTERQQTYSKYRIRAAKPEPPAEDYASARESRLYDRLLSAVRFFQKRSEQAAISRTELSGEEDIKSPHNNLLC